MYKRKRLRTVVLIVAIVLAAAVIVTYVIPIGMAASYATVYAAEGTPTDTPAPTEAAPTPTPAPETPTPAPETPAPTAEVVQTPAPKPSVTIRQKPETIAVGEKLSLSLETAYTEDLQLEWSSSDPNVVAVDTNGNLIGVAPGLAEITVKAGDARDSFLLTVTQLTAEKIRIVVSEINALPGQKDYDINVGDIYHLSVVVDPEGAHVSSLVWVVGDTEIATLDDNQEFIATGVGKTDVTVVAGDLTATVTFNITENGIPAATIMRYVIFAAIVVAAIIVIILLMMNKKKKEEQRKRAAKKRREAELSERGLTEEQNSGQTETGYGLPEGYESFREPRDLRETKVYGSGVGAYEKSGENARPFSIDDIE